MSEKPRYFDSWKGRIAKAIVLGGAATWAQIRDQTGLSAKSFNAVLSEMMNAKALEKQNDGTYRLEYNLYKTYKKYLDEQEKQGSEVKTVSISEAEQKDLIQWMEEWRSAEAGDINPKLDHFYLSDFKLDEFSRKVMARAKKELVIVNPFVKQCTLSDTIRSNKAYTRVLVTRSPDSRDKTSIGEYHQSLKKSGARILYNERVHAKLIVVDRTVAIVSSLNFYGSASGGQSWEAGIITKQELVIEQIMNDILILMDSADTKE